MSEARKEPKRKSVKLYLSDIAGAIEALEPDEFGELAYALCRYIVYGIDEPPKNRGLLALYKTAKYREDEQLGKWRSLSEINTKNRRAAEDAAAWKERQEAADEYKPAIEAKLRTNQQTAGELAKKAVTNRDES